MELVCNFHCRFEKYIGGKYLGELVRLVLLDLNQKKLVFQNTPADAFPEPWSLDTSKLSEIEEYVTVFYRETNNNILNQISPFHRDNLKGTTHLTKEVLTEAGFKDITDYDISITQHAAAVISHRAALLVSITTSVLMERLTCQDITIAIDGSVYKGHPRMHEWLTRILSNLNSTGKIVSK